jgi:hypothetical protein
VLKKVGKGRGTHYVLVDDLVDDSGILRKIKNLKVFLIDYILPTTETIFREKGTFA